MTKPWMIVAGDFVRTGGMDAANFALASYLARAGRETHVVAHRVDPELRQMGVLVHPVPRPFGSHLLGFPLLHLMSGVYDGSITGSMLRNRGIANRKPRPIVTMANGGNYVGTGNWLHYVHAAYEPEIAGRPLRRTVDVAARAMALRDERRSVRAARAVIANSERTKRDAVQRLGADPARVHTVYYGAEPERFRPATDEERTRARRALRLDEDAPALAFVGALGDRRKGFDTLYHACAFLCANEPAWDATLLVAGTGGELEAWKQRAATDRLGSRIRFLGFRSDVREVLAAADALVSPTRYEAYGLAVQEALLMALPAIVSRDAGVAERIPRAMGPLLIREPEDAGEVAERLHAWHSSRESYRTLAHEASVALGAWTWDDMARRIVDIVEGAA
jgi:glycosyltransferase involved in cell wall biosynthesis